MAGCISAIEAHAGDHASRCAVQVAAPASLNGSGWACGGRVGCCKRPVPRPRCALFPGWQVEAVKKVSEYVSQLRRVGKGLGVYQFDKQLAQEVAAGAAA